MFTERSFSSKELAETINEDDYQAKLESRF